MKIKNVIDNLIANSNSSLDNNNYLKFKKDLEVFEKHFKEGFQNDSFSDDLLNESFETIEDLTNAFLNLRSFSLLSTEEEKDNFLDSLPEKEKYFTLRAVSIVKKNILNSEYKTISKSVELKDNLQISLKYI